MGRWERQEHYCTQTATHQLCSDILRPPQTTLLVQTLTITACATQRIAPALITVAASTGTRIIQHSAASMAAYSTFMTLLPATAPSQTDFAKPVIKPEGLILLVHMIFHQLRFCLLTNGPQQGTRMICHHSTSVCSCHDYALLLFFLPRPYCNPSGHHWHITV